MSRSVLLVLNGSIDTSLLERVAPGHCLVQPLETRPARPPITELVAVDGGLAAVEAAGLRPGRILGDLDSLDPRRLEYWRAQGVPVDHRPDTGSSDSEKALEYAREAGFSHVDIAGWQGTRWDHMLGLLSMLDSRPARHPRLLSGTRTLLVLSEGRHTLAASPGDGVGVVRFGRTPCRLTLTGLEYPANRLMLGPGCGAGSNRVVQPEFTVVVEGGPVFLSHTPVEADRDS